MSEFDEEHSRNEDRWITLGLDRTGTLLVVFHSYEEASQSSARIRLISARKATRNEIEQYKKE
ncbi:MAG: BrnT family toxin [Acidobacteriota bacterium]|nr:BrnT family toxin [Acidobacteriota bacterium]